MCTASAMQLNNKLFCYFACKCCGPFPADTWRRPNDHAHHDYAETTSRHRYHNIMCLLGLWPFTDLFFFFQTSWKPAVSKRRLRASTMMSWRVLWGRSMGPWENRMEAITAAAPTLTLGPQLIATCSRRRIRGKSTLPRTAPSCQQTMSS